MIDNPLLSAGGNANYLLVEGSDDAQVLFHFLRRFHLEKRIVIQDKKGINQLLDELDVELDRSGLQRLSMIVDADSDITTRWQSIRDRLSESGYNSIPLHPQQDGAIIEQTGRPKVGIWLMPNNKTIGMLEDFITYLVPHNDILWSMAEDIVERVEQKERRFPVTQVQKARLHTWLAWQAEPGKPMGQAITKKYFDTSLPESQRLLHWLRRAFDIDSKEIVH